MSCVEDEVDEGTLLLNQARSRARSSAKRARARPPSDSDLDDEEAEMEEEPRRARARPRVVPPPPPQDDDDFIEYHDGDRDACTSTSPVAAVRSAPPLLLLTSTHAQGEGAMVQSGSTRGSMSSGSSSSGCIDLVYNGSIVPRHCSSGSLRTVRPRSTKWGIFHTATATATTTTQSSHQSTNYTGGCNEGGPIRGC